MIRLFATDLDGTLLNDQKTVNHDDRDALGQLHNQGIRRCLASGRLRSEMIKVAQSLEGSFDLICQNGAHVETAEGEVLLERRFTPDLAISLYPLLTAHDVLVVTCLPDKDIIETHTTRAIAVEKRLYQPYQEMPDLPTRIGNDILPSKFSLFGDMADLKQVERRLHETFSEEITTYVSDFDCLDIMPGEVSKGAGLAILMNRLHLTKDDTACIGDSFNDVSMFSVAKYSFAMDHAVPGVKEQSTMTATCVADAVKQLMPRHNIK